eukprot:2107468-Amphidinium_carterae.1
MAARMRQQAHGRSSGAFRCMSCMIGFLHFVMIQLSAYLEDEQNTPRVCSFASFTMNALGLRLSMAVLQSRGPEALQGAQTLTPLFSRVSLYLK